MIIKSTSRKVSNFDQLYDYMKKGADKHDGYHAYSRNIYSQDRDGILKEFYDNAQLFQKRKNSVYMYHEIISITRSDKLSIKQQQEALFYIVNQYAEHRAEHNLVQGFMHNDAQSNIHFHLMISSNEHGKSRNYRLSKKEFDAIKKQSEVWANKHYPELKQGLVINHKAEEKLSNKGAELKRRTGHVPERERVMDALKNIFNSVENKQSFFNQLSAEHLEIYTRGKHIGFKDVNTGRKYRLKTLGLSAEFRSMSDKISLEADQSKQTKETQKTQQTKKSPTQETEKASKTEKQKADAVAKSDKSERARQSFKQQREAKQSHSKTKGNQNK